MAPAAYTSAYSAAADTDHWEDGRSHPTFTTRPMPSARAASSTPSTGSPRMSMCVCASRPPGSGSAVSSRGDDPPESAEPKGEGTLPFGLVIGREPGNFLVNHGLVQLGEQRGGDGKRRARRHRP